MSPTTEKEIMLYTTEMNCGFELNLFQQEYRQNLAELCNFLKAPPSLNTNAMLCLVAFGTSLNFLALMT